MTAREKIILYGVGTIIIGSIAFNLMVANGDSSRNRDEGIPDLQRANRLLRSRLNINERSQVAAARLSVLQAKFLATGKMDEAQLNLLKMVEELAMESNLEVAQKNMLRYADNTIGVLLEGKTTNEALIKFMQRTTQAQLGLRVNRLQIHCLPEQKLVSYQLTIITMLITEKEK